MMQSTPSDDKAIHRQPQISYSHYNVSQQKAVRIHARARARQRESKRHPLKQTHDPITALGIHRKLPFSTFKHAEYAEQADIKPDTCAHMTARVPTIE
eukprot:4960680-Pleurochrysis_carterae.AAC.9